MSTFRFRWCRRPDWGLEVFDAWLGAFRVGQVTPAKAHGSGKSYWAWRILLAPFSEPQSEGTARTARAAAVALEAAFPSFVLSAPRFAMRTEREAMLRAVLQLPHTAELDHALAVERGEHVRPISPNDHGGWRRWLDEERRRGARDWISPEDMEEWFDAAR